MEGAGPFLIRGRRHQDNGWILVENGFDCIEDAEAWLKESWRWFNRKHGFRQFSIEEDFYPSSKRFVVKKTRKTTQGKQPKPKLAEVS